MQELAQTVATLRQGWALAGLTTVVVVAAVAASNFNEIYQAQRDFVAGSLLSLAGFCFGKALSRFQTDKLLGALREPAAEALTRLERDLETGMERVQDYYDQNCRNIAQYSDIEALRVALFHLDKSMSSAIALRSALTAGQSGLLTYSIDQRVRLALTIISRDLHEAIGRRDQAYHWYRARLDHDDRESWDVFRVMTSDMLKGERLLTALMGSSVQSPPEDYLRRIERYLLKSTERAEEFIKVTGGADHKPKVFEVMLGDLRTAIKEIGDVSRYVTSSPS